MLGYIGKEKKTRRKGGKKDVRGGIEGGGCGVERGGGEVGVESESMSKN